MLIPTPLPLFTNLTRQKMREMNKFEFHCFVFGFSQIVNEHYFFCTIEDFMIDHENNFFFVTQFHQLLELMFCYFEITLIRVRQNLIYEFVIKIYHAKLVML